MMQEYIFVELNKFNSLVKNIDTNLDAWLKLILTRTPTDIEDLIARFSSFQSICSDAIMFLNDKEAMLSMILEGLSEMDDRSFRNMIKRWEAKHKEMEEVVQQMEDDLKQKEEDIKLKDNTIKQLDDEIAKLKLQLTKLKE